MELETDEKSLGIIKAKLKKVLFSVQLFFTFHLAHQCTADTICFRQR
jgi:hypothetical protein